MSTCSFDYSLINDMSTCGYFVTYMASFLSFFHLSYSDVHIFSGLVVLLKFVKGKVKNYTKFLVL